MIVGEMWRRLIFFFRRTRSYRELEEEMEHHVEMKAEARREQGLSSEEARRAARREFGNTLLLRERSSEEWGWGAIETILQDLRYSLRMLHKSPGFTVVAVLTLAFGIGANTAMFSVLNAVLLRPLPYQSPARLAMLWRTDPVHNLRERSAYWDVKQWRSESKNFAGIAIFDPASVTLTGGDHAERIGLARVSPNFFQLLGIQPLRGRAFSATESQQRQRLVLISYRFWQTIFGGSQGAVGATIQIDGVPLRVIGILPAGFKFLESRPDIWEPDTLSPDWDADRAARGSGSWFVVGRLRRGVSLKVAQAEMNTIARRLDGRLPASERNLGIRVVPLSLQVTGPKQRLALWMLAGAVFLVLLIAAANVAGLLLARNAGREREITIRAALGATLARIVRQLLTESLTLAGLSGLLGLAVAWAGLRLILLLQPGGLARLNETSLDSRALGWTLTLCLLTGVLVGLSPAIAIAGRSVRPPRHEGGRGVSGGIAARKTRHALVVTEFALAIILLVGAGLLIRSFWSVENVDPGFRPEGVLSAQLCTPASMTRAQRVNFYSRVIEQVESLPGVKSSGMIGDIFVDNIQERTLTIEGTAGTVSERLQFRSDEASAGFFKTLGTPLISGRLFSKEDGPDSPHVAIINTVMARRLWPGLSPVGRRFQLGDSNTAGAWFRVVGVVGDMHRHGLEKEPVAQMFVPLAQDPSRLEILLARTSKGDSLTMAGAIKAAVHRVDKGVPVYSVTTLENRLGSFLGLRRFETSLLIAFSAVALLMAAIGIFGLIQYSVTARTHEIGIRMALGAEKSGVLRMVMRQGLELALIGLAIGIGGALGLTRFLSSLLYGVKSTDSLTFVIMSLFLTVTVLLACYLPARRAMRVDPMTALRHE